MQDNIREKICCAILAGGKSERLANKPFLLLNGKPLISYVLDAAYGYFKEILIVIKSEQDKKIRDIIKNKKQTKIAFDDKNNFSPWNGIKTAVKNTEADWIFLLACDMPFICTKLFNLLASKINSDIDCIIPHTDRLQPLCALYRKSALANAHKEGSLTRFAESLKKKVVTIEEKNSFWLFNINTKEDFEKAEELIKTKTDI